MPHPQFKTAKSKPSITFRLRSSGLWLCSLAAGYQCLRVTCLHPLSSKQRYMFLQNVKPCTKQYRRSWSESPLLHNPQISYSFPLAMGFRYHQQQIWSFQMTRLHTVKKYWTNLLLVYLESRRMSPHVYTSINSTKYIYITP